MHKWPCLFDIVYADDTSVRWKGVAISAVRLHCWFAQDQIGDQSQMNTVCPN